jgi:two-component system sensor histidine kinase KdpD
MNRTDADRLGWVGGGAIAAVLLGMVLVPLRELTSASNLTFAFLALTIVVAELGGGGAAVATALASSLSLDFFLTRPYLTLAMEDKHDLFAFLGLTACGLVAAAVGSHQSGRVAALRACRARQELVRHGLDQLAKGAPRDLAVARVLDASVGVLPVADAAVHDMAGNLLAATGQARGRPAPVARLDVLGDSAAPLGRATALPHDGVRVPLVARGRLLGWLDVWGDANAGRAGVGDVADLARLLVLILALPERQLAAAQDELPESRSAG